MAGLLVNIDVEDVESAAAFYAAACGLRPARRLGPGVVEMLGADAPIYLLAKSAGSRATDAGARRDYARHWTPVHLDFVVPDIGEAVAKAQAAGATLEASISESAWGKLALMADPFGNGFCFVEFTGRGYDALAEPPAEAAAG